MNKQVLEEIVLIEWEMFRAVSNDGGTAPCQQDQKTFSIMRVSQLLPWTDPMRTFYLKDLREARRDGRNLMAEKYARMMQDTFPEEYRRLEGQLPPLKAEAVLLADRITDLMVHWARETQRRFPNLVSAGRPMESSGGSSWDTSLKTYLRSELLTYGIQTLGESWDHFSRCQRDGINGYEAVLENTVRMYGFASLAQAEANRSGSSAGLQPF